MTGKTRNRQTIQRGAPDQRGFALLVIFLMAAAVAFTMYQELPRAAFESVRDKEQILMDRGNQYKRAIQVFYAENKRYPAELKDLEKTTNKRYLRRRYIDPMTGHDEWRLIHTNGAFLTDSLVQKPPAQNTPGGLPGQGQTPGGGPLGANNLNTSAPAATDAANTSTNPGAVVSAPVLNPMAQQRPSDRRFPTGPGFPQAPGLNPGNPGVGGANPFGSNSTAFDPSDPRTWPAITLASPASQPGQMQQSPVGTQPPRGNQPNAGMPLGGQGQFPLPPGQFPGGQSQIQGNLPPANFGQANGHGGGSPQPSTLFNPNPIDPNGLAAAPSPFNNPNAPQPPGNANVPVPPFGMLNAAAQQPPLNSAPASALQAPNLAAGGFNPQANMAAGGFNPQANLAAGGFNPQANLAAGGFNPQASPTPQPNPALPGNNSGNAALNAIDNALFRPNQAAATGAMGSPGIAGVATTFKGPSIRAYRDRTKYQEWEFVYESLSNQPGANQPAAGLNQAGQPGAMGQNSPQNPGPLGPSSSQPVGGSPPSNIFSPPSPFGPGATTTR